MNSRPQQDINLQPADVKTYFMRHLNKIYCAKNHLVVHLPEILNVATFSDLKEAIGDNLSEVRNQISRLREIFDILKEKYEPQSCQMFAGLIDDLFDDVHANEGSLELRDMSIIYYLQNMESLEMASFNALQMAAAKFANEDINELLKDNFDAAQAERNILRLLTAKYLTSQAG